MASEDRYRQLFEAAPDAVFLTAADGPELGRILDANSIAATMHGYSRAELLSMRIGDLDVPDDADAVPARMRQLIVTGAARFRVRHRRRDGSTFPVEVSARLTLVDGRRCVVAFNRDISADEKVEARMREHQLRLEMAAHGGGIGFWDWDLASNTVFFTPEWKAQLGYQPEEIEHRYEEWERRVHPDDLAGALQAIRAHLAGDTPNLSTEFRLRHKDGGWRWIFSRGETQRDAGGRAVRMVGCHVDITERKLAESKLREAELVLRSFYESPGVLRGIVDLLDGDILHVSDNRATGEFFGVDETQLAGKCATELGTPRAVIDLWLEHYLRAVRDCAPVTFDYCHPQPEGLVWLSVTVVSIGSPAGRPRCVYAAVDQTARKRAEGQAAENAARIRAIYETDPQCIKTTSLDGRLLDINPAGLRFVEADSAEQVVGTRLCELIHPDDQAAYRALHQSVIAGGSGTLDYRMTALRGTQRWMEVHSVPLRDRQGAITSVLSVTRDVTDRKRSEEERAALDRQLEQLQRLEAIGTLSGGIAHDFNNILAAITGNLDLAAMEGGQSPSTCEYLAEIRRASNRARALVRQILAFSCSQRPDRHVIALENIVAEVQRFMRATIPSTIAIRTHVAAGLPPVHADAAQMHQVLVNLCTNAAHAMEDRPGLLDLRLDSVELEAGSGVGLPAGRYVRLEVRDTGVGMDASVVERVFEPFFTTKPVGKGSGLGLSVVHGIVQGHGGAITVESQPGRGSTFRVLLPAANVAVPEVPAADVVISGHGEHVLVLDDEQAILRALRQGLERNGYRVTACERPDRALALLADPAQHFDVLVTDLELPGMRGLQVAQRARALAADLPIVMCSGYVRPEAAAMAGANGVGRVLVKPVALAELTTAIQELLPARKPG